MYAKVKKTGEILYDAYMDEIDNDYYLVKGIDKEGKKRSFYPHETTDLYSSTKLIVSFNKKEEDTKQVCFLGKGGCVLCGGGEDSEMSKLCHTLWMPPKEYDKEQHCICNRYDTTSCNFTEMDMSKVFILAKNGRYIPFEEALKMRERISV